MNEVARTSQAKDGLVKVTGTSPYDKARGELPRTVQVTVVYEEQVGKIRPGVAPVVVQRSGTLHLHLEQGCYVYHETLGYDKVTGKRIFGRVLVSLTPSKLGLGGN